MAQATLSVGYQKFHTSPTMYVSGSVTVTRNSQQDSVVHVSGSITYTIASSSYYGTPPYAGGSRGLSTYLSTPGHATGDQGSIYGFSKGASRTQNINQDIEWTSGDLILHVTCNWQGYHNCDHNYDDVSVGALGIGSLPYNPSTPATNAWNGRIYSTNNSGGVASGTISDKPDCQVWWNWDGAIGGTPDNVNGISAYNIDINTINDVNGASSIAETQNYSKGNRVSLFTLCRNYGIRVGGTLYCWVNTRKNDGNWLGRVYLGAITMRKDGSIKYKDSAGTVHEVTKVYYKDSLGNINKGRYAYVKDSSGATHVIDVFTTLYE